jgi:hypothetical protein
VQSTERARDGAEHGQRARSGAHSEVCCAAIDGSFQEQATTFEPWTLGPDSAG